MREVGGTTEAAQAAAVAACGQAARPARSARSLPPHSPPACRQAAYASESERESEGEQARAHHPVRRLVPHVVLEATELKVVEADDLRGGHCAQAGG